MVGLGASFDQICLSKINWFLPNIYKKRKKIIQTKISFKTQI